MLNHPDMKIPDNPRPFDANVDPWHMMAYILAKILKIRPLSILHEWSCEELLVTFGVYMNQLAADKYDNYKSASPEEKKNYKEKPPEYVVKFITYEQLADMAKPKTQQQQLEEMKTKAMVEAFMKGGGKIG